MSKISIDPIEIAPQEFLRAFYRDDNAEVYYRTFADKENDPFAGFKAHAPLKNYEDIAVQLRKQNELQRGVFFVVNGGGQKIEEVKASGRCQAQFMEIDDYPMDIQLELINAFPIIPSIIVKTRKSLHTYWLVDNGDIFRFRNIQEKLIKVFGSDPKIKDESRVMRIPTYYHCKADPVKVEVIHFNPELRYTQDQIEAALMDLSLDSSN